MLVRGVQLVTTGLPGFVWVRVGRRGFIGVLRGRRWMLYTEGGAIVGSAPDLHALSDLAEAVADRDAF